MFNHTLKMGFLLILVGDIMCSIGLSHSQNLLIFKFRNSKFDLKDNFVNNLKKLECLQIPTR